MRSLILKEQARSKFGGSSIVVMREQLFESSCGSLMGENIKRLKGELNVRYWCLFFKLSSKRNVDLKVKMVWVRFRYLIIFLRYFLGSGVKREWFRILANEMFNPNYALFIEIISLNNFLCLFTNKSNSLEFPWIVFR